jgi:uncharacterized protein YdhG (YjbR/CyaY superfamily)
MPKTDYRSVREYIAAQPASVRPILERVRGAIRKGLPDAEELISYQIPAYALEGRNVLYFAGWKTHVSLYPVTARLVAAFREELEPYEVEKATLRFPLSKAVPVALVTRIARFRAQERAAPAQGKRTSTKTARKRSRR